jgi:hypothetical protein
MSLVSDGFHQKVPHVISEIVVSPEITGEPVTTRIIDTSRTFLLFFQKYFFDFI